MSAAGRSWVARADRLSLLGMAAGLALMLLCSSSWTFRAGFFVVLASTCAQVLCARLRRDET